MDKRCNICQFDTKHLGIDGDKMNKVEKRR